MRKFRELNEAIAHLRRLRRSEGSQQFTAGSFGRLLKRWNEQRQRVRCPGGNWSEPCRRSHGCCAVGI
jgi:hypothetical protein